MFVREIKLNAHEKPLTLPIGITSAKVEIEPSFKYYAVADVDMYMTASNDVGVLAVSQKDFFVPKGEVILLLPTGCKYFAAVAAAAGIVQLVRA